MRCSQLCRRVCLAVAWVLLGANVPLRAEGVGDPQIKTDDLYYPGELAMSTLPRLVQHAYSIPRGTIGSVSEHDRLIKIFLWRAEHYTHMYSPQIYQFPGLTPDPVGDVNLATDYDTLRSMFS